MDGSMIDRYIDRTEKCWCLNCSDIEYNKYDAFLHENKEQQSAYCDWDKKNKYFWIAVSVQKVVFFFFTEGYFNTLENINIL